MRWLSDGSAASLAEAVRVVAPHLGGRPIEMPAPIVEDDPLWWSATAVIDGQYIAKFPWSRPAALRVVHEIGVLTALAHGSGVPYLPDVVASSVDPVLLITRRVPGAPLFQVVHSIDRDDAGSQLASFLAALHHPAARDRVEAVIGHLPDADHGSQHPAPTRMLRERFGTWVRPDQRGILMTWYGWVDATLGRPAGPAVLAHGDLHGDNQIWADDELRLVVDFENSSAAEPEYDLRALPGTGPGVELLTATLSHYQRITGRRVDVDRVMAWHLRGALGDALWRSEAGIPLPDHRTPIAWVDDIAARLHELGIDPGASVTR